MKDQPLVSVLTPSFQQGTWLEDNLRSVANQSYANVEHVVMDGGSRDRTLDILERESDPRLRWWSEPDSGQSHALNKALSVSRGDIVGWLNSDDAYFGPTVIGDAVELFRRRPEVAVVYGHAALVNADGLILHLIWVPPFSRRLLKLHDFILQPAAFIRRTALDGVVADEALNFAMDYDLWLRLSAKAPFARINRIIAIDRHHDARKSTRMLGTMHTERDLLRARYGIDSGRGADAARKIWKIISRIVGATLLPRAFRQQLAFDGWFDRRSAVIRRQVAARRASMPMTGRRQPRPPLIVEDSASPSADGDDGELVADSADDAVRGAPNQDRQSQ